MDRSALDRPNEPLAVLAPAGSATPDRGLSIAAPVVTIGQGPQNDLVVDDDTVSNRHARLEFEAGTWRLSDLESRNGTYLDGDRLAPGVPTPLVDGSMVAFGAALFRFGLVEGADPTTASASASAAPAPPARNERSSFRLPLWLLIVILIIAAAIIAIFLTSGGNTPPVDGASVTAVIPVAPAAAPAPIAA